MEEPDNWRVIAIGLANEQLAYNEELKSYLGIGAYRNAIRRYIFKTSGDRNYLKISDKEINFVLEIDDTI